jgi:hypothetical protein
VYWGIAPEAGTLSQVRDEPTYSSPHQSISGEPTLRIWRLADGFTHKLTYATGLTFWVDSKQSMIWATWPDDASMDDAIGYFLGPVLGIFLRLLGETCLHASAVAVHDRAVVFVGPLRSGKSTTAAALNCRGYAALCDDIVLLREREGGRFWVIPSHPFLSLWPESVLLVGRSAEQLPRVFPKFEKRRLRLSGPGNRFESRTLPIGGIYLLGRRDMRSTPCVEEVSMQTALITLVADTYATYALDRTRRVAEFETLGRLVSSVPIRRICGQEEVSDLDRFCDLICDDYSQTLRAAPVALEKNT